MGKSVTKVIVVATSAERLSPQLQHLQGVRHANPVSSHQKGSGAAPVIADLTDMDTVVLLNQRWLINFVNRHIRDPDLALDIVQESFMKAYLARDQFQCKSSLRTWLASIALNLVRDHKRSQKERFWQSTMQNDVDLTDSAICSSSRTRSAESQIIAQEAVERVAGLLKEIPLKYRDILVMRLAQDMSLAEIATRTGTPLNTVKSVIHRVLAQLRSKLSPYAGHRAEPKRDRRAVTI